MKLGAEKNLTLQKIKGGEEDEGPGGALNLGSSRNWHHAVKVGVKKVQSFQSCNDKTTALWSHDGKWFFAQKPSELKSLILICDVTEGPPIVINDKN